jgi:hypothetical protein
VRARAGPWQISASFPIHLRTTKRTVSLRSQSSGAVRFNQITHIRSKVLYPVKALSPESLESPISCSHQPQHGNSTSTLYSICQARVRLFSLDSTTLESSPGIDLSSWIFGGMPHLESEAVFPPLHRDNGALYGDLMCRRVQKPLQRGLSGNGCSSLDP